MPVSREGQMATRSSLSGIRAAVLTIAFALLILVLSLGPAWLLAGNAAPPVKAGGAGTTACTMSEEGMRKMAAQWFAVHPESGVRSLAPATAVVKVQNFLFHAGNNPG